jgi:hypothetical protein
MRNARRFRHAAAVVLAVLTGLASGASAGGTFVVDDPNAVLRTAIAALKGIEQPATGRGRARMTIRNGMTQYVDKEVVVDFVFKNQSSRTDVLVPDASGALTRFYSDAVSDKASIRVDSGGATVQRANVHERSVGYDFSPGIFLNVTDCPITKYLEFGLHDPDALRSLELDDRGILHYMTSAAERTPAGKPRTVDKIWFDTQKGFLPVYYEAIYNDPDGTWGARTIRMEWAQYNGIWYVSRVERDSPPGHKIGCTFVVESFTPNVDVNDQEFTLDGFALAEGTRIDDTIAGISYPYGFAVQSPAELEKALRESEFVKKIIKVPPRSSGSRPEPNQARAPAEGSRPPEAPTQIPLADGTGARAVWTRWAGLLAVIALLAGIGFFAYRRKTRAEKS